MFGSDKLCIMFQIVKQIARQSCSAASKDQRQHSQEDSRLCTGSPIIPAYDQSTRETHLPRQVMGVCIDQGTFPSVSSYRPIKIPKDQMFQPPSGPWSHWSNSSRGLVSHCFYDAMDKPAIVFATEFKPQVNAKDRGVDKCIWTAGAPCFGWSKWPCIVHGQSALCFVGITAAEQKVDSWSETTLQQLFQD